MTSPAEDGRPQARAEVLAAAHRCVDVLVGSALLDGSGVPSWPSWVLDAEGHPEAVLAGCRDFYAADAGITWALRHLGSALGRADARELAEAGAAALLRPGPAGEDRPTGLLVGAAGTTLLAPVGGSAPRLWSDGSDLTDGLAGILLALARLRRQEDHAASLVAELDRRCRREEWGLSWPDSRLAGPDARPLCGLAHGASGIAWALAEAAAVWPRLAAQALDLAGEALAWEASWSDPARGGWPDLRGSDITWPDLWCHGAAGAGAVRLRILELAGSGLDLPWSLDTTRAEAEAAVQRCGRAMGEDASIAGWTLCHGNAGPAATVLMAADLFGVAEHRHEVLAAAAAYLDQAPADPGDWPCGLRGADGDLSLLNGVAGTAMVLTDAAVPGAVPSAALLGLGGVRRTLSG